MPGRFATIAGAGYLPFLLAILPPDAKLGPKTTVEAKDRGKVPGRYKPEAKEWIGQQRWQAPPTTLVSVQEWDWWESAHGQAAGIGLRLGKGEEPFQAADHDEDHDAALVEAVRKLRIAYLGETPLERGRPNTPRSLALYRTHADSTPLGKQRIEYVKDGRKGAFEWLGEGQQCVILGRHKTGTEYTYTPGRDPVTVTADKVPRVTSDQVLLFLTALIELLQERGYGILKEEREGRHSEYFAIGDKRLMSRDMEKLARAVEVIDWAKMSYGQFIAAFHALKQACGGSIEFFADHVLPKVLLYPGSTADWIESKWNSITSTLIGAEAFYCIARKYGFLEPPERVAAKAEMDDVIERYIFLRGQDQFFDTITGDLITSSVMNKTHPVAGDPANSHKCASYQYMMDTARRRYWQNVTYWPGESLGPLFRPGDLANELVNKWRPSAILERLAAIPASEPAPTEADAAPYFDLLKRVLPEERDCRILLDKMAHTLQRPGEKPNWHIVLLGEYGIGKDTLLQPMMNALGKNGLSIEAEKMIGPDFNEWRERQTVLITEVHAKDGHTLFEKLKSSAASNASAWVAVNVKNKRLFDVPDTIGFYLTTNDEDAIALPSEDRRFCVLRSPMTATEARMLAAEGYFKELHGWLRDGGSETVAHLLLRRELPADFDAQGWAPMTDAKRDMSRGAMSAGQRWIIDQIEADDGQGPLRCDLMTVTDIARECEAELSELQRRGLTDKAIAAALKAAGAKNLGQIRTGGRSSSRERLWALRRTDLYSGINTDQLRGGYLFERRQAKTENAPESFESETTDAKSDPRIGWLIQ